jgi:phosphoribosylamine---glycine ligase
MNILLLGSGGREHAFAWKIINSGNCKQLFVAPGNAGTAAIAQNVNLSPTDFDGLADFALENHIDMIVVGPEEPLVRGVTDYFQNHPKLKNIPVIGPSQAGAHSWKAPRIFPSSLCKSTVCQQLPTKHLPKKLSKKE